MQKQLAGFHTDIAGHMIGGPQLGLAFADGHNYFRRCKGQQFAKPPNAALIERVLQVVAASGKLLERAGTGTPTQSYSTSIKPPSSGQVTWTSSTL